MEPVTTVTTYLSTWEATVGTYELRSYGGEQEDRQGVP